VARWRRVAGPFESELTAGSRPVGVNWTWRVHNDDAGTREIRVEVIPRHNDGLPEASKEAIRTKGASAVDSFSDEREPPQVIRVGAVGVQARDLY
jgi:hypothetical protein